MKKRNRLSVPSNSDLQYAAVMETLEANRLHNGPHLGCFHVPVKTLRDAAKIPSGEVRRLLGSRAETCNLEGCEWLAMPWVDFVAVGKAPCGTGKVLWAALITSVPATVRKAAEDSLEIPYTHSNSHPRPQRSAKLRRYLNVIKDLTTYEKPITRVAREVNICGKHAEMVIQEACPWNFGYKSAVGGASVGIEALVFCAQSNLDAVSRFFASTSIIPVPVPSLQSFFECSLVGLRMSMGVGWFPDLDRFAQVMKGAVKAAQPPNVVSFDAVEASGSLPRQRAVAAGSMFACMGWSTGELYVSQDAIKALAEGENLTLGDGQPEGNPDEGAGYRWSDGDIQVFRMPNAFLPGDEVIQANSVQGCLKDTWISFESPFPQDRVLVAIRYKGYGPRNSTLQEDHEPRNICLLPPLHVLVAGVLRRLLRECEIQVIGYTAGESATTRSGLLERLAKRYCSNPSDAVVKASLLEWIRLLTHRTERLVEPRVSILDECCRIEQGCAGATPEGENLKNSGTRKKASLTELLFRRGSTGSGSFRSGCLLAGSVVREILHFKRVDILNMVKRPATSAVGRIDEMHSLNQKVQETFADDKDVRRTHGAKFRILALYKDLALFYANLCRGYLGLPENLHDWIRSNFEFVCLMPLDHVAPARSGTPRKLRSYAGQFQSHRYYPLLFSCRREDASVIVDVGPLLAIVGQALDLGDKKRTRGWLTNKISETNEMAAALLIRIGADLDFPIESLALEFARTGDPGLILNHLDSRLMVRCILESPGGEEKLREWCENLGKAVRETWQSKSQHLEYASGHEKLDSLLEFFRDYTGLAAAALDCCRKRIVPGRENPAEANKDGFVVYFNADRIRKVFIPRRPKILSRETPFTPSVESTIARTSIADQSALDNECEAIVNKLAEIVVKKPVDMFTAKKLARKLRDLDPVEARSMAEHLSSIEEHQSDIGGNETDSRCYRVLRNVLLRG
jgi:hypothetical protein